ncbi:hypothetical protein [Colwellia ponticola]|uniref:Uncharacterized protein n=1 Tax=Colwellia ponticola TaxID=2304625 RepID=A0A8H2PNL3_9GAMM|nr:hypothetical protein [Colwellia ponticola]RGP39516.1 hypothetical protein BPTFM16_02841 [Altererythrobacter insulae]TMM46832.1 hypothetical protein FCS21_03370 [Colwellia ponticola]
MSKTSYSRTLLFGRWYRSDLDDHGNECVEYAQLNSDGSFEFSFITLDSKGDVIDKVIELGDWGLVADIHFTFTKNELVNEQLYAADLNNDDNYQAYKVITLNHKLFHYQHLLTNEEYIMRRVVDNPGHC